MPKGGARSRSGPPPDPNALRRDRKTDGDWVILPAEGRPGPPPEWPLHLCNKRERELWEQLWSKPQATEWERLQQQLLVGLYVRRLAEAEQRMSRVNLSTLVRQMSDDLGLTSAGLARNRWRIEVVKTGAGAHPAAAKRSRAKSRLTVVADDAVEGAKPAR